MLYNLYELLNFLNWYNKCAPFIFLSFPVFRKGKLFTKLKFFLGSSMTFCSSCYNPFLAQAKPTSSCQHWQLYEWRQKSQFLTADSSDNHDLNSHLVPHLKTLENYFSCHLHFSIVKIDDMFSAAWTVFAKTIKENTAVISILFFLINYFYLKKIYLHLN